jgi:Rrf2 family protein
MLRRHGALPGNDIRNTYSYMKHSTRFPVALHLVMHLAEFSSSAATSEWLAACVRTNPVVVRRTLARLRRAGLVASAPGLGGGWSLTRDGKTMTLQDVYAALEERPLRAIRPAKRPAGCLLQQAVAGALDDLVRDVEATLAERLRRITVADLSRAARRLGTERRRQRAKAGNATRQTP